MKSKKLYIATVLICIVFLTTCIPTKNSVSPTPSAVITPSIVVTAPMPATPSSQIITPQLSISSPTSTQNNVFSDPETVISNCDELLSTFRQKLKTTGWIRNVFTIVYFDNLKKEYHEPRVKEEWYRFDTNEQLIEAYNWVSTQDGVIEQEAIYQGGIWYNVTFGGSSRDYSTKVDFTGGFANQLKRGENITQEAVNYHDANTWRFYFEMNDGGLRIARAIFINRESSLIAGNETYVVKPGGTLQLVSGTIYTSFEVDADPPLQRFEQILEKAQNLH